MILSTYLPPVAARAHHRARLWLALLLVVMAWSGTVASAGAASPTTLPDPRAMKFSPVTFAPPDAERVVLDNGMVVYLLEDH